MLEFNAPSPTSAGVMLNTALIATQLASGMGETQPSYELELGLSAHSDAYHVNRHAYSHVQATIKEARVSSLGEFADHRLVVSAQNAFSELSKRQKLLGEDFQRVLSDNLWDLYEE